MVEAKTSMFNSFKCSSCGREYFTTEQVAGKCYTCQDPKHKTTSHPPASRPTDPDYDKVLIQQELAPAIDGLVTKLLPIIENKFGVKITPDLIAEITDPACVSSKPGFFAEFKATVYDLIVAMPPGMIVTVKALRHAFDVPSSNRSKCIFFNKVLRRFEDEGLLKQVDGTPLKFVRI
jgi:hypothetical protein